MAELIPERLSITLIALLVVHSSFAQPAQIDQWGNIRCANGTSMLVSDLIKQRGAVPVSFNASALIPAVCTNGVQDKINAMVEGFKQQDQANIQSLANNFCSHMSGWVEYLPGACSAGGPPPICKIDHWKQIGTYPAIAELEKLNKEKAIERANKMAQANSDVCACAVGELQKQDKERAENFSQPLSAYQAGQSAVKDAEKSAIKIACVGEVPPGYICKDGYLKADNATLEKQALDKAVDYAKDKAKDKAISYVKDKAMDLAGAKSLMETLKQMATINGKYLSGLAFVAKYSTFFSSVATGVINPDGGIPNISIGSADGAHFITGKMSGGNELYNSTLAQISSSVNRLTDLYNEIIRLNTGQNQVRNREYITDDIAKERSALGFQLQLLDGYKRETSLTCQGCCNQMFDYQHTSAVNYANKIMTVNIE